MEGKLKNFQVGNLPTVIYRPDFITENEETQLLEKIYEAPLSKWKSLKNRRLQNWGGIVHEKGLLPQELPSWLTKITQRIYEESGLFPAAINRVLINEYLPDQGIMPHQDGPAYFPVVAILSLGSPVVMDFIPHSRLRTSTNVSRNDVEKQESGIDALEIEAVEQTNNHHPFSVLLMPRNLLIFKDNAYSDYLHGIKDSEVHQYEETIGNIEASTNYNLDQPSAPERTAHIVGGRDYKIIHRTGTRVSLTCRLVLKVHKNLFKI